MNSLMLNHHIQNPENSLKSWKQSKKDPNNNAYIFHDEALAENPNVAKQGSEANLHMDSTTKLMRGKNFKSDDILKQKIDLEKKGMLNQVIKENEIIEMSGAVGGAPIAPIASSPAPIKSPKKNLNNKIEKSYNRLIKGIK